MLKETLENYNRWIEPCATSSWQLCPKCNGDGNLSRYNSPNLSTTTHPICDVCHGAKIIATPSPTGDRDCEELKKENDELKKEIECLKGLVNDDLRLAVSVLNRILTHLKMDLGAVSAKKMLYEIDSLSNQEINSQEKPLF